MAADFSCRRQLRKHLIWKPRRAIVVVFLLGAVLLIYKGNGTSCTQSNGDRFRTKSEINKDKVKSYLFIAVLSSPNGRDRRDAIRNTWLSDATELETEVVHKFVIGSADLSPEIIRNLRDEATKHNDLLIFEDFKDSYFHLTSKVLRTFRWINDNVETSFIFKADDDTFARLDQLVVELKSTSSVNRLYWGFFRGDANVKHAGQWAEKKWILCDHYLPFAQGGGYLLSADLVQFIASNYELLQLYNSEDVSVGSWLAPLKIRRIHDPRFDTEYRSRGCNNAHIVSHKQSVKEMHEKHRELKENGRLCKAEVELRKSFKYDWTVPPSQCCKRKSGIP